jgi:hypothetical protein
MQNVDGPAKVALANNDASTPVANAASVPKVGVLFLASWLGTIAAGAAFGAITGGIAGFIVGAILAAVVGVPVYVTVVAITQLLWLGRHLVSIAGSAGTLTGIAATSLIWDRLLFDVSFSLAATMAALFGGTGGVLGTMMMVARSPKPQESHDLKPVAKHSFSEVLLRFSIVAGFVAAWCWLLMSMYTARLPVSVVELESRFEEHQAEFNLVASMAKEDKGFSIYSDGSFDDEVISRERGAMYLAALSKAGLNGSRIHSKHEANIRIEISPKGGFRDGIARKYLYTNVEQQLVVVGFAESDVESIGPGQSLHLSLGNNWYVSIERPVYID